MQFGFVRSSLSSSFVEFRRVSTPSSFRSSSFAPFGAYETCFYWSFRALLLFFGSLGVAVMVAGGQVRGIVGWSNLGSFLVESTSVDSFWLSSLRIVLPLELEISFV